LPHSVGLRTGSGDCPIGTIVPFLEDAAFEPVDIAAMSRALDEVCKELKIADNATTREIIAIRIIELARRGERDPTRLRDRLLNEANGGTGL
jgi:hypothetical protein